MFTLLGALGLLVFAALPQPEGKVLFFLLAGYIALNVLMGV